MNFELKNDSQILAIVTNLKFQSGQNIVILYHYETTQILAIFLLYRILDLKNLEIIDIFNILNFAVE